MPQKTYADAVKRGRNGGAIPSGGAAWPARPVRKQAPYTPCRTSGCAGWAFVNKGHKECGLCGEAFLGSAQGSAKPADGAGALKRAAAVLAKESGKQVDELLAHCGIQPPPAPEPEPASTGGRFRAMAGAQAAVRRAEASMEKSEKRVERARQ